MTFQLVIVGGGLAGAAAACSIAAAGRPTLLLERETGPVDKLCGEFISIEAQNYLARLGIELAEHGAVPIRRLRLVRKRSVVEATLPFIGLSLSRQKLDEVLLRQAGELGADIRRGHAVRMVKQRDGIALDVSGMGSVHAHAMFIATGKQDVRGARRHLARTPEDLLGFKSYFSAAPAQRRALDGYVELLMLEGGYAGLQQVEDGRTNLCLLITRKRFELAGGTWTALLDDLQRHEPHLSKRLNDATALNERPLSIYRVPFGHIHRLSANDPPNVFRIGDQVGVTPSFTGDGMSIALHTAARAAEMYLAGCRADAYHARIRQEIGSQIRRSMALYRLGRPAPSHAAIMAIAHLWPCGLTRLASFTRLRLFPTVANGRGMIAVSSAPCSP